MHATRLLLLRNTGYANQCHPRPPIGFNTKEPQSMEVPWFFAYHSQESMMDTSQAAFYRHWLENWKRGTAVSVEGNISYLFTYTYGVLGLVHEAGVRELERLLEAYGDEKEPFPSCCRHWLSDFFLANGDFREALRRYPPLTAGGTATHTANEIFNIKRELGEFVGAVELMGLIGPKLTAWARKHLDEVVAYLDIVLDAHQKSLGQSLLVEWSVGTNNYGWHLFNGSVSDARVKKPYYCYYAHKNIQEFALTQMRDAENTVRESKGVPRVGEGWVAETTLYYEILNAFPSLKVVHHARPGWLKPQHLDVYLPDVKVALEYQGAQHDKPVEYFGGEKQFRATQKRDAKKLKLCLDNSVVLVYVREGYELEAILAEIQTIIAYAPRVSNACPPQGGMGSFA